MMIKAPPPDPAFEPASNYRHDDVHRVSRLRWLLVLPVIAPLCVPIYNRVEPRVASIPFFYWYQIMWVLLCGTIIGLVFLAERRRT